MKNISKKILLSVGLLLGLFLLFLAIWITANMWPRPLEPEIWSAADLSLSENPSENAWNLLPKKGEEEPFPPDFLEIPENLYDLLTNTPGFSEAELSAFWKRAEQAKPSLASFLQSRQKAVEVYKKLLEAPQFVDNSLPDLKTPKADLLYLMDLHKIGRLHLMERALQDDWKSVYDLWREIYRMDLSWVRTARSVLSHRASLSSLEEDIRILACLGARHRPEDWASFSNTLAQIPWDLIHFERALIYEYRTTLNSWDQIIPEKSRDQFYYKVMFNPAMTRKLINDRFRKYNELLKNPAEISEGLDQKMNREQRLPYSWFWWFKNPGGKSFGALVFIDLAHEIKEFYGEREALRKMTALLVAGPLPLLQGPIVEKPEAEKPGEEPKQEQVEELAIKRFGECDCRKRTVTLEKRKENWVAVVLDDGLKDDSVQAYRFEALLEFRGGRWEMGEASKTWRCWPGRGHADFSTELCR